jgi:hypothetical protein
MLFIIRLWRRRKVIAEVARSLQSLSAEREKAMADGKISAVERSRMDGRAGDLARSLVALLY